MFRSSLNFFFLNPESFRSVTCVWRHTRCTNVSQYLNQGLRKLRTATGRCEGVGDVVGVEAPLGGVAQVIFDGVQVVEVGVQVRVHQDRGVEEDGEGQVEVEREVEEVRENDTCATWRENDRLNELEPMWCDTSSVRHETQLTARCCAHLCRLCAL